MKRGVSQKLTKNIDNKRKILKVFGKIRKSIIRKKIELIAIIIS
jgi:hypothetical protein